MSLLKDSLVRTGTSMVEVSPAVRLPSSLVEPLGFSSGAPAVVDVAATGVAEVDGADEEEGWAAMMASEISYRSNECDRRLGVQMRLLNLPVRASPGTERRLVPGPVQVPEKEYLGNASSNVRDAIWLRKMRL